MIEGVKIAVRHQIFPTELIKLPISYVNKFSKMSDSKKKIKCVVVRLVSFLVQLQKDQ